MRVTTALRKIASLRKKIKVIQGGQGAGKTISVLTILINHASSVANREIIIASEELTKMRLTVIKDFVNVIKDLGIFSGNNWISGTLYRFPNGSFIKFVGLDKADVGKGLRCHVLYINEANKCAFETAREVMSRADTTYLDFNPNNEFWVHEELIPRSDCDFLKLTYMDNEALKDSERNEILLYKEKGYNLDGTIKNKYWANKWNVYGLGMLGILDGVIFQTQSYKDLPSGLHRFYGIDWGGNDPTVLIEVNVSKKLKVCYVRELLYQPLILNSKLIDLVKKENTNNFPVICDNARKDKIYELQMEGIMAIGEKGNIIDGIDLMQDYSIFVHEDSLNIKNEFNQYKWLMDKKTGKSTNQPEDMNNHSIDALRYVIRFYNMNYSE